MENLLVKTTALAMELVGRYVKPGDAVVDATAGNGYDTLSLAKMVGAAGRVYAFDIQKEAIENTRRLLEAEQSGFGSRNLLERVTLINDGHDKVAVYLAKEVEEGRILAGENGAFEVSAVVFNLGYLPTGSKDKTTKTESTVSAVRQALSLLRQDGIIAITMYDGHEEGRREKEALLALAAELPAGEYHGAYVSMINQRKSPPEILWITKKQSAGKRRET